MRTAKADVSQVLLCYSGHRQLRIGKVHALAILEESSKNRARDHFSRGYRLNAQLDQAVVNQDALTGFDLLWQRLVGNAGSLSGTLHVERSQHESLIGLQLDGLAAAKGSKSNLGSLQIGQNRR